MAVVTLHLNGLLARGRDNCSTVSFEETSITVEMLLTVIKAEIPAKTISFVAVNGTKAVGDILIKDGDTVDIFPAVTGG